MSQFWKIAVSIPISAILLAVIIHACAVAGTRHEKQVNVRTVALNSEDSGNGGRPTLPSVYLSTEYMPPVGKVINVRGGGNLQIALNSAKPGDAIVIEAGATFTGNFTLPNTAGNRRPEQVRPSEWIIVRSSASDAQLPPGSRVTPSSSSLMPKIQSPNPMPALNAAPGAGFIRIVGIEVTIAPDVMINYGLVKLGQGNEKDIETLPHHIIIDRCYIHGTAIADVRRGVALNSASSAVIDSYISDCHQIGADTQAIGGWGGPGPFKIVNNYLEAAGENVMFGGADPRINGLTPSDIEVRNNHLKKPLSWKTGILAKPDGLLVREDKAAGGGLGSGITYYYSVTARGRAGYSKTATSAPSDELRFTPHGGHSAARLTWNPVEYATEYRIYRTSDNPESSQRTWVYFVSTGTTFTDSNQTPKTAEKRPKSGTRWTVKNLFELKNARRVLIENNLFENCWKDAQTGYAIVLKSSNQDGSAPWSRTEDVTFRSNVVRNVAIGISLLGKAGRHPSGDTRRILVQNNLFEQISGDLLKIIDGPVNVVVDHNTSFQRGKILAAGGQPAVGFVYTNNIAPHNKYGVKGDGSAVGRATLAKYFPDGTFRKNVIIGGKASDYPPDNFFVKSLAEVGLVERSGHCSLSAGSPYKGAGIDGKDPGCNQSARD